MFFDGERLGPKFQRGTERQRTQVLAATRGAAQDVSEETLKRGRADILRGGKFTSRWTNALHVPVTEGGGFIRIELQHDLLKVGFRAHQFGALIRGRPLLWIPLQGQKMRARDFPGRLIRITSKKGSKLLVTKLGKEIVPQYVGKPQVTLRKRFHVVEIARAVARRFADFYKRRLTSGK